MRCRSCQKNARRGLPPGSTHHESEPTFRWIARKRSHADPRRENFVSQGRAKVPSQLRQSRRRSRYDRILSSAARFYRPSNLMQTPRTKIHISIRNQRLTLKRGNTPIRRYPISTSRFGIGSEEGSMKTPTGRFRVVEKIGAELPLDTVFQSRVPLQSGDQLPRLEHNSNLLRKEARQSEIYKNDYDCDLTGHCFGIGGLRSAQGGSDHRCCYDRLR